jgi:hypothetical protein
VYPCTAPHSRRNGRRSRTSTAPFGSGVRVMTVDARKGNTPGACHEGISDTGELRARYPRPP